MSDSKKKIFLAWLWVVLCAIGIFLTVPVARRIQKYVYEHWGRELFGYVVLAAIVIGFVGLFYYLIFKLRIRSPSNYIWLFIVGGLYVYFTLKLWKIPEEAIHFLEYGLLSFFLFKALIHHVRDKSIYFTATLFALLFGTFDEILQWITAERFWDFRDAGLNALSGGLFQLAVWKIVKPKIISEKMKPKSARILSSIFVVCAIVLGLCVSNTPNRVGQYTKRIPALSFLRNEEPMSEFGYKHKDSEIGFFYSRLSKKRLQKTDAQNAKEYAEILNASVNMNYGKFLEEYNPMVNPFLYELRIHIFRRNRYFNEASAATEARNKRESYFIAYKENLILQKYFEHSIEDSHYKWNEEWIREAGELIDKDRSYISPVSSELFTDFTENDVWRAIVIALAILVSINIFIVIKAGKKNKRI